MRDRYHSYWYIFTLAKLDNLINKSLTKSGYNLSTSPDRGFCIEHFNAKYYYTAVNGSIPSCLARSPLEVFSELSFEAEFNALEKDTALQDEMKDIEYESGRLFNILRRILNLCENISDLYALIPKTFLTHLSKNTNEYLTLDLSSLQSLLKELTKYKNATNGSPQIIKILSDNLIKLNKEASLTAFLLGN